MTRDVTRDGKRPPHENTRDRLVRAATTLFAQKGFDATSIKDVVDLAGVNISLVSYHFGGKEGLYLACVEPFGQERLAAAQRVLESPASAEEFVLRLRLFIEEVLTCHLECSEVTQILHREFDLGLPHVQEVFERSFMRVFQTFTGFIAEAKKNGILSEAVDPHILAGLIYTAIIHVGKSDAVNEKYFHRTIKDKTYRDQVVDHLLRLCTTGCLVSGSKPPLPSERGPK